MKSSKEKILYLGLDPSRYPQSDREVVHFPIIQTIPRPFESSEIQEAFRLFPSYSHLLFTSRTAVKITLEYGKRAGVRFSDKKIIAIGRATAALLERVDLISSKEHAEGVVDEIEQLDWHGAHFFFPRSSLARPVIVDFFLREKIDHTAPVLYETHPNLSLEPTDLQPFEELVFTSPST
ncbi:MAG: hypothetical protein K940chlam2_01534, partial [Chlamydiae bacterium]|nr:hypothetical protein [Chlamydiota bacterium]